MEYNSNFRGNNQDFRHKKQPIHLHQFVIPNLQQNEHLLAGSCGLRTSPSRYSNQGSPLKSKTATLKVIRAAQQLSSQQKLLNSMKPKTYSSKYIKFSNKIEVLQKNLNRLSGQLESLKQMLDQGDQLSKNCELFQRIQKFRQKIQEARINKFIQVKRFQARYEIAYDQYLQKFGEIETQLFVNQGQRMYQLQKISKNQINKSQSEDKFYNQTFNEHIQKINLIKQNIERYICEINTSMQKQSEQLLQKLQIPQLIQKQKQKIKKRIQCFRVKLGQLKCITEYQMFLQKQYLIDQQLIKYNSKQNNRSNSKKITKFNEKESKQSKQTQFQLIQDQKLKFMQQLQLKLLKEQRNFVGFQSLDRLAFQLANIDLKFVTLIQNFNLKSQNQPRKTLNHSNNSNQRNNLNNTKSLNNKNNQDSNQIKKRKITLKKTNSKQYKQKTIDIDSSQKLQKQILGFNYELQGLKQYLFKSQSKISKIQEQDSQKQQDKFSKNQINTDCELQQSIKDLEEKISVLDSNYHFFKSKQFYQ